MCFAEEASHKVKDVLQHEKAFINVTKATLQKAEVTLQRDKSRSANCRNGFATRHKSCNYLFDWIKANALTFVLCLYD